MNRSKWNIERDRHEANPRPEAPWASEQARQDAHGPQSQRVIEDEIRHLARIREDAHARSHDNSKRDGSPSRHRGRNDGRNQTGVPEYYAKDTKSSFTQTGRRWRNDRKSARRSIDEDEGSGFGY